MASNDERRTLEKLPTAKWRVIYKKSRKDAGSFMDIFLERNSTHDSTHDFVLRMTAQKHAYKYEARDVLYKWADRNERMDSMAYYARFVRMAEDVLAGIADKNDPKALFEKYLRPKRRTPVESCEEFADEVWGSHKLPDTFGNRALNDKEFNEFKRNERYRGLTFKQLYDLDRLNVPIEQFGKAGDFVKGEIRCLNDGEFDQPWNEGSKAHRFVLYANQRFAREEQEEVLAGLVTHLERVPVVVKTENVEEDLNQVIDDEPGASQHLQTPEKMPRTPETMRRRGGQKRKAETQTSRRLQRLGEGSQRR